MGKRMMGKKNKPCVLVVDDVAENIDVLAGTLADDYEIKVALNGKDALNIACSRPYPDLILLDIIMPGMDGYEVCQKLKSNTGIQDIPVIFLTAMTDEKDEARGLELGAVDYVTKPFNSELVKKRIKNHLELKLYRDHLERLVKARTRDLVHTQDVTIETMGTLAEFRDPETGGHIKRTQNYIKMLAQALKDHPKYRAVLDDATIAILYKSSPLHDIGKVGIRDTILLDPGKLTNKQFDEMKKHSLYGRDVILNNEKKLGEIPFLQLAKEIAYTHHEKWDGSGYPQGLKGDQIPVSGRLMAVVDVYDALISKRVYKPPFSHDTAIRIIKQGRASHFDPDIVDAFESIEDDFRTVAIQFADCKEELGALTKKTDSEFKEPTGLK